VPFTGGFRLAIYQRVSTLKTNEKKVIKNAHIKAQEALPPESPVLHRYLAFPCWSQQILASHLEERMGKRKKRALPSDIEQLSLLHPNARRGVASVAISLTVREDSEANHAPILTMYAPFALPEQNADLKTRQVKLAAAAPLIEQAP
jgi:hypothetical protein